MPITKKKLETYFGSLTEVSFPYFVACTLDSLDSRRNRIFGSSYYPPIYDFRNRTFESFLCREFRSAMQKWFMVTEETATPFDDVTTAPIWQIWLQGLDERPIFIRKMMDRVEEKSKGHPVRVITLANFEDYISIPSKIMDLYRTGKIGGAHLSDIMRVNLLKEYGGVWLDATTWLVEPVPDDLLEIPFASVKDINPNFPLQPKCVNSTMWATYFMTAQPHSVLFSYMSDMMHRFFERFDDVYDYLLPNHFYKIAFDNSSLIAREFDLIRSNNLDCELLSPLLESSPGDLQEKLNAFCKSDTFLYKMSSKASYFTQEWQRAYGDIFDLIGPLS